MLDFGATFLPDPPSRRFVERVVRAEELGFSHGWTYDSHILWQEGYVFLTLAAAATSRIHLGHCVTNPGIREPTVTASAYATLQQLSEGRMALGIGRGDSSRHRGRSASTTAGAHTTGASASGSRPAFTAASRACSMIQRVISGSASWMITPSPTRPATASAFGP